MADKSNGTALRTLAADIGNYALRFAQAEQELADKEDLLTELQDRNTKLQAALDRANEQINTLSGDHGTTTISGEVVPGGETTP